MFTCEFYFRLYNYLVMSEFLYWSPIWLPYKAKHINMLEAVQKHFLERLCLRCGVSTGTFGLPSIEGDLSSQDVRVLKRLILLGLTNRFFDVHPNSLRSKCTVF